MTRRPGVVPATKTLEASYATSDDMRSGVSGEGICSEPEVRSAGRIDASGDEKHLYCRTAADNRLRNRGL